MSVSVQAPGIRNRSRTHISDPTSSLRVSLKDFESTLSENQKSHFSRDFGKLDQNTVISFITEIDQTQGTMQRSVSSRLCTFLEAVQKFAGIVDTFVSSNPSIAALVWGGVKTTLLATSHVSSYFDKVTNLIMEIGRMCPPYQSFGALYPGCVELQKALCEYYALVVRLCTKIVTELRKPDWQRAARSVLFSFETEFSEYTTQIRQAAEVVKIQSKLASERAAEQSRKLDAFERAENESFRHKVKKSLSRADKEHNETHKWRLCQQQRENLRIREVCREGLSSVECLRLWNHVRQQRIPGTAEWFQENAVFRAWRSSTGRTAIWCKGKMGTGKTVLMSSILEHLQVSRGLTEVISYHFCLPDRAATLQERQVLGNIARQILDSWIECAQEHELHKLHRAICSADNVNDIVDILSNRMRSDMAYIILLDGIDECEAKEANEVIQQLAKLFRNHENIKIIFSSRTDSGKRWRRMLLCKHQIEVPGHQAQSDIERYIAYKLDHYLEDGKLKLNDPELRLRISDKLKEGAQEM